VDLLVSIGSDLFPVEIKAGVTIGSDAFKGLEKVSRILSRIPFGKGLIYGGDEIQVRSGVRVYPVTEIEALLDSVAGETAEPGR
jgi:hypothetical protein